MVPLEQESNVEVLRAYGLLATREVERLSRELAQARHQEVEQGFLSDALKDRLTKLQEKFFGFGREKFSHHPATHHKDPQLLVHGDRQGGALDEVDAENTAKIDSPKNFFYKMEAPTLKQEALSRGFPMNKANDWEEVKGLTQDSVEITVTERVYEKVVHKQQKYRFRPSIGTDKEIIVTAPGPVKINPG